MVALSGVQRGRPGLPRSIDAAAAARAQERQLPFPHLRRSFCRVSRDAPGSSLSTTSPTVVAYPPVADSLRAVVTVRARLDKISSRALVVTNARGSIVAARQLGRQRRGPVKVRWNGHVGRRPAVPGGLRALAARDRSGRQSLAAHARCRRGRISRDRDGDLTVNGRSRQEDGTLSARYWSEAAKERKDPAGILYFWKGERPRDANAPQLEGTGEIVEVDAPCHRVLDDTVGS